MKYCALCCIAKDEDLFLKEWIAYHALIGVEHFYIYDNVSSIPIADLLGDWNRSSGITIIRNPGRSIKALHTTIAWRTSGMRRNG